VNGTYKGTTCDGHCKALPKPPPLAQQLADFAAIWQNETWTCVLRLLVLATTGLVFARLLVR
jgi:hypothetical protein